MMVQNIWLMHLNQARYWKYSFHLILFYFQYVILNCFLQAPTTLQLSFNEIGDEGVKYVNDLMLQIKNLDVSC